MPATRFETLPRSPSRTDIASITQTEGDLIVHSAWMGEQLVWLGLAWVKDGAESVHAKAQRALPHCNFIPTADTGQTGRIMTAWRANRLNDLPMTLFGTPFQHKVWQALLALAPLERPTYGQIAARIGNQKACRAVGTAVGSNPITLLVPCHRILPHAGGVGNYGWGAPMKGYLLALEDKAYAAATTGRAA
ncbi:MAG: methylated-DNA--[protein]-cysteine S-methyltransferase [Pseudomonadota bacterium]